jgi:hypothetical protein
VTTPATLRTACHVAVLDVMTGSGYLVRPHERDDVLGLHGADWDAMVRLLASHGFEPTEGEDGGVEHEGFTASGREVVGLCGREPVHEAGVSESAQAFAELRRVADAVR